MVAKELRSWRKPGHHISQDAPSSNQVGRVRLVKATNTHTPGGGDSPI